MIENDNIIRLINLTKEVILECTDSIYKFNSKEKELSLVGTNSREMKAEADILLEKRIIKGLSKIGYPILSEETGLIQGKPNSQFRFIVDPLDGTYNFVRGLGPCAISIGFWDKATPIFGVVYDILNKNLFWGGKNLGTYSKQMINNFMHHLIEYFLGEAPNFPWTWTPSGALWGKTFQKS